MGLWLRLQRPEDPGAEDPRERVHGDAPVLTMRDDEENETT
jgi:hypothetical protein